MASDCWLTVTRGAQTGTWNGSPAERRGPGHPPAAWSRAKRSGREREGEPRPGVRPMGARRTGGKEAPRCAQRFECLALGGDLAQGLPFGGGVFPSSFMKGSLQ